MSKPRYELKPGVNQVRVGSTVIGERGHTAIDDEEAALLDANPALQLVEPKARKEEDS